MEKIYELWAHKYPALFNIIFILENALLVMHTFNNQFGGKEYDKLSNFGHKWYTTGFNTAQFWWNSLVI